MDYVIIGFIPNKGRRRDGVFSSPILDFNQRIGIDVGICNYLESKSKEINGKSIT